MDKVFEVFLEGQQAEVDAFCKTSDRLTSMPHSYSEGGAPTSYIFRLQCRSPVRVKGVVQIKDRAHLIAFSMPDDYLRIPHDPGHILCLLEPSNIFHPNVMGPMICIGDIAPAASITDILVRVFEVLTCQRITMREADAFNHAACEWARHADLPLEEDSLIATKAKPSREFSFQAMTKET